MKKVIYFSIFLVIFILVLSGCKYKNAEQVDVFKPGDIKDDFCGVDMDFRYCKCAFHNEFCDEIGMSKKEAKIYIEEEYEKWLDEKEEAFKRSCEFDGGYYDPLPGNCVFCPSGMSFSEKSNGCVGAEEKNDDEKKEEESPSASDEATEDKEEKMEEEKPKSQADCDSGTCFVNGDCLPMLIECKGGAFMKTWDEVCPLATKYQDGQPLSTEICYCHGNYCYIDQKCQEIPSEKYCGDERRAKIKNSQALCALIQKDQDSDIEALWDTYCECQTGLCNLGPGQCEEPPNMESMCDIDRGAKPKSQADVCATMKREKDNKPVVYFDWCECMDGYDEDWEKEICVKQ